MHPAIFQPASAPPRSAQWFNPSLPLDARQSQSSVTLNCGYTLGAEIGKGSFATVHSGFSHRSAEVVAIKSIPVGKLTKKLLQNLNSEIQILQNMSALHNPNIVNLLAWERTDETGYLVMEWCEWGDLSAFIKKKSLRAGGISDATTMLQKAIRNIPLTYDDLVVAGRWGGLEELVVKYFLGQLSDALHFLRSHNLMHRDVKPQNLLLNPPVHLPATPPISSGEPLLALLPYLPIVKLADFGFARYLPTPSSMAETLCGSPLYMAPEILRYEKYDARADLWSVGAVLYECLFGRVPFRAQNHIELVRKIEKSKDRLKFPRGALRDDHTVDIGGAQDRILDEDIVDLIKRLLKQKPATRMNFDDYFRHPSIIDCRQLAQSIRQCQTIPRDSTSSLSSSSLPSTQNNSTITKTDDALLSPRRSTAHPAGIPTPARSIPVSFAKQNSAPVFDSFPVGGRQQQFRPMSVPAPIPIPSTMFAAQRQPGFQTSIHPSLTSGQQHSSVASTFETNHSSPPTHQFLSNRTSPANTPPRFLPASRTPPLNRNVSSNGFSRSLSNNLTTDIATATGQPITANVAQIVMQRHSSSNSLQQQQHSQSFLQVDAYKNTSTASSSRMRDKPLEKDYVVIEKKAVEVNSIADKMRVTAIEPPTLSRKPSINMAIVYVVSNLSARLWGKRAPISPVSSNDYLIVHSTPPTLPSQPAGGATAPATSSLASTQDSASPPLLAPGAPSPSLLFTTSSQSHLPLSQRQAAYAHLIAHFPHFPSEFTATMVVERGPEVLSLIQQLEARARRAFALSIVVEARTENLLQMLTIPPRDREYLQTIFQLSEEALILDLRILSILSSAMTLVRVYLLNIESRSTNKGPFIHTNNTANVNIHNNNQHGTILSHAVEYIRALYNKTIEHSEMVRSKTTPDFDNEHDYFFSPAHSLKFRDRQELETEWLRWIYDSTQILTPCVGQLVFNEAHNIYRQATACEAEVTNRSDLQDIEKLYQLAVALLESLILGTASSSSHSHNNDDTDDDSSYNGNKKRSKNYNVNYDNDNREDSNRYLSSSSRSGQWQNKEEHSSSTRELTNTALTQRGKNDQSNNHDLLDAFTENDHILITQLITEVSNCLANIRAKVDAFTES